MIKRPYIGIGVIILRNGKLLLGKRRNAHGAGSWCCPGGHLEYGESFEACARREVSEETGLEIENIRCGPYTNDLFDAEGKHYVTLFMLADCPQGAPRLCEPEKCERWAWFSEEALPRPLFLPLKNLLAAGVSFSAGNRPPQQHL